MKLFNKNILLISPEPWNHIFVSKHHYAIHLGKRGNKVFFVNPPGKEESVKPTRFPNVFEVTYKGFPIGLRYYPRVLQQKKTLAVYRSLEILTAVTFDVIWSFDNSVFFDFSSVPERVVKISHIVDFDQDFQTSKAAKTANICLSVTEQIRNALARYNARSYKINHGFSVSPPRQCSEQLKDARAIKAVYAGNLSLPFIDWDVIHQVVKSCPEVEFFFIGPHANVLSGTSRMRRAKKGVFECKNVSSLGRMAFDELQQFYRGSDILFVAYQQRYHDNQVANTHKMMEYLGSGNVVVATKTSEYSNFYPLIAMCEKNSEWPERFRSVVCNLNYYNSAELRAKRIAFALRNTYEEQIKRVEDIISNDVRS